MLNIPDEVKALFSSDTVKKNFHVRFPNGEYTDLNNENLISESVNFTESLCSQQYFKFGLAEASQIEFTAAGIPNVRGAYIEAAIEIDCTRLGAAWASNNPVDPTLDFLEPQTCEYQGKIYYRVPYGLFKVDTCPRDHGAMWQRKITAFSDSINENETKVTFETLKNRTPVPNEGNYVPNLYKLFAALCNQQSMFTRSEWATTVLTPRSGGQTPHLDKTATVYLENDTAEHTLTLQSYIDAYSRVPSGVTIDDLYTITSDRKVGMEKTAIRQYIRDDLGIDWETTLQESDFTTVDAFLNDLMEDNLFYPSFDYSMAVKGMTYSNVVAVTGQSLSDVMYARIGNGKTAFTLGQINVPHGYYYLLVDNNPTESFNYKTGTELNKHELDLTNIFSGVEMSFKSTLKQKISYPVIGQTLQSYSFANAYSLINYIKGQLELCGWFFKPVRNGSLEFFQMSENPAAIPVSASDWGEFWWDENPIDAIGRAIVIYREKDEDQQQTYEIGDGNSVYTFENNEVLANANLDQDTMQEILETFFAPNARVVNFTPVDLEMRGLPYLESGDYIELTAEDGTTVQTYILSQTISGIQHLEATVTSTNGELLEVIENE